MSEAFVPLNHPSAMGSIARAARPMAASSTAFSTPTMLAGGVPAHAGPTTTTFAFGRCALRSVRTPIGRLLYRGRRVVLVADAALDDDEVGFRLVDGGQLRSKVRWRRVLRTADVACAALRQDRSDPAFLRCKHLRVVGFVASARRPTAGRPPRAGLPHADACGRWSRKADDRPGLRHGLRPHNQIRSTDYRDRQIAPQHQIEARLRASRRSSTAGSSVELPARALSAGDAPSGPFGRVVLVVGTGVSRSTPC